MYQNHSSEAVDPQLLKKLRSFYVTPQNYHSSKYPALDTKLG
jgi:hypothetical protein